MVLNAAAVGVALAGLFTNAVAQQAGTNKKEEHVPITFAECTKSGGCTSKSLALTMDAQWRWLHDAHPNMYGNCINGLEWDTSIAKSPMDGASFCALEGMTPQDYKGTYGVSTIPGGVNLNFKNGQSIGSRLYMMEDTNTYKMFKLLNKEFTFDVDASTLECGLNGAVYFVEMEADGGRGKGGNNTAGAKFGTGYCDAQCPLDLKFIGGKANVEDWHITKVGPLGRHGSCCSEMDIWEANKFSTAYTAHPCHTEGPLPCDKTSPGSECGYTPPDCKCCSDKHLSEECPCCQRYKGVCDKDGCDYNHYRLGDQKFYGDGPEYTVDSSKPITIVTQFITSDNTDTGDLVEIRRLYVQNNKLIKNSETLNLQGFRGDSITDEMCAAQKTSFNNRDDFKPKGGLKQMGKALGRGMVLVLSLWDDMLTKMTWLDSTTPTDDPLYPITKPGVKRGPCSVEAGDPNILRNQYPMSHVRYANIMVGEIGTTYGAEAEKVKGLTASPMQEVQAPAIPGAAPAVQQQGFQPQTAQRQQGQQVMPGALVPAGMQPQAGSSKDAASQLAAAVSGIMSPSTPWQQQQGLQQQQQGLQQQQQPPQTIWPPQQQPQQLQPAAQSSSGGGAVCCTAAKDANNPCGENSCQPGSDMRTGFCVQDHGSCTTCGGTWCPNGLTGGSGSRTASPYPAFAPPIAMPTLPPLQPFWPQAPAQPPQPPMQQQGLQPAGWQWGQQPLQPAMQATSGGGWGGWAAGGMVPVAVQGAGGSACCTAASDNNDPCGSCYPGSGIKQGWCVEKEDRCTGNCGGHWCPNGIVEKFELPALDDAREALKNHPAGAPGVASWAAGALLVGFFAVATWARAGRRQQEVVPAGDARLDSATELQPLSEAA